MYVVRGTERGWRITKNYGAGEVEEEFLSEAEAKAKLNEMELRGMLPDDFGIAFKTDDGEYKFIK